MWFCLSPSSLELSSRGGDDGPGRRGGCRSGGGGGVGGTICGRVALVSLGCQCQKRGAMKQELFALNATAYWFHLVFD